MYTNVISIGNSRGVRIPKTMIEEAGIDKKVELNVSNGILKIVPVKTLPELSNETALLSEKSLLKDWGRPEEDKAWAKL